MTVRPFDPGDPSTWPATLNIHQVAAIYGRKVGGLRKACQAHARRPFLPAPVSRQPHTWRKVEIERDRFGARGVSLRRAS